jgi:hypothetical protein
LWQKAFETLSEAFEKLSVADTKFLEITSSNGRDSLEELLSLVQKTEQKCQQKKWKWKNRGGQVIVMRDVFAKMVTWIQRFKSIGDILVQYDPGHASLPWAFARFVLQVSWLSAHDLIR